MHGWTPLISMQHHYNLLQRLEEREMFPLLEDKGMGSIPWSPLARGRLARPWGTETPRSQSDPLADRLFGDDDEPTVTSLEQVAARAGKPMAQVAIAWLLTNPGVTAPLIGATKPGHLADAVAALDVQLTATDVDALEQSYRPHAPTTLSSQPLRRRNETA